jgi:hypothetical protein
MLGATREFRAPSPKDRRLQSRDARLLTRSGPNRRATSGATSVHRAAQTNPTSDSSAITPALPPRRLPSRGYGFFGDVNADRARSACVTESNFPMWCQPLVQRSQDVTNTPTCSSGRVLSGDRRGRCDNNGLAACSGTPCTDLGLDATASIPAGPRRRASSRVSCCAGSPRRSTPSRMLGGFRCGAPEAAASLGARRARR